MRWEGGRRSDNVEDRRGLPLGRGAIGGGIGVVVVAVIAMFLGIDPRIVLEGASRMAPPPSETARGPVRTDPAEERLKDFVSVVLADTEDTWTGIFADRPGDERAGDIRLPRRELPADGRAAEQDVPGWGCHAIAKGPRRKVGYD